MGRGTPRRRTGSVTVETTVDVDIFDVIENATDDQIRAEYEERFGLPGVPSFDLVAEVLAEIVSGRVQAAAALCEGYLHAASITEAQKQAAFQAAGRAH